MTNDVSYLVYCRPGFEKDAAAELQQVATESGVYGYVQAKANQGYVRFHGQDSDGAEPLQWSQLLFARQLVLEIEELESLPEDDRAGAIADCLLGWRFDEVFLDYADTNEGKSLSGFTRKFRPHLERHLKKAGVLRPKADASLHVFLLSSTHVILGMSTADNRSPYPMGIPRLRMPREAPSRSTLKLEEAVLTLLDEETRELRLKPGLTAVDLGAAPGGWTWQLVQHGLRVTAVDNGPMSEAVMATGLVEHVRADGFTYLPPKAVDWLVCDMVEKPARVTERMLKWLLGRHCRYALFNLKLPMKQRYPEAIKYLDRLNKRLSGSDYRYEWRAKQLYHDREEITVFVRRLS